MPKLNLDEIIADWELWSSLPSECWIEGKEHISKLLTWLPALVAELTQAREELAAVDESLGDFYAPVLDPETEKPCGSFWKDHGVWVMRDALNLAWTEIERLRVAQAKVGRAFDWLWGFWVGNTLVAASASDREEIQKAFEQLANDIGEANTNDRT